VAVLFLDLDNFKTVNDSLGHSTGDMLLGMVAEYLVECMRSSDTVARLGGDEFAVLVEDIENRAEASQVAERILGALRRPVTLGSQEIVATVSIGIALGLPGSTAEQLLRDADLAMYKAKEQGKNRYEEFRDQMHTTVVERLELEAGLRSAVVDKDLVVHYQPIVDLRSASIAGFEALVRWQHPTKGLLSPEAFIPFAEQIGLVESIDHFVLAQACGQLVQWEEMGIVGPDCAVSVNLSTRNMVDGEIAAVVAEVLADTGLRAANLILEITEGTMMKDIESALRQLDSLKALGLRISVDDFGTGYSSLAYLQRLPIDILKIDRTFVAAMTETSQPVGLASAIIRIAETLGQTTIAEGVETAVQVDQLVALGCHLGQGYHLGVPLNGAQTESLLRDISGTPAAVNT